MRELKFRVWSKYFKCYNPQNTYELEGPHGSIEYFNNAHTCFQWALEDAIQDKQIVIEQYTGLKDWNGKDIYEGDIIGKDGESMRYLVEYKEHHHPREEVSWIGYNFDSSWFCEHNKYVVIGNIHENPELL